MGWSEDKAKIRAGIECLVKKIEGKTCWEPQYDYSHDILLAYHLGFFKGRICAGQFCMNVINYESKSDHDFVIDAWGLVQLYMACMLKVI